MGQKLGFSSVSSPFDDLPDDCIANIISLTSPRDACVAASVSKTFKSTSEFNSVWEKFLPPEYSSFILGSQVFTLKKELYLALCNDPVLIEDGQKIRGWMKTRILSPRTHYSAYVVYKTRSGCHGFRDLPIQVGIGLVGQKATKRFICFDESADRIKRWGRRELMKSKERQDGWIEAEIGDFFNELGSEEIELSIIDITSPYWKRGLIIQGIEFRPVKG
ncbi:hypothetical protein N665_0012s0038 [Sinapis alba]|nr:hypothetical protein N665_0012s0038 [Sinapis alba]